MTTPTLFTETWEETTLRLCLEIKALRAETEFAPVDDPRWRTWTPRFRQLRTELDFQLQVVS